MLAAFHLYNGAMVGALGWAVAGGYFISKFLTGKSAQGNFPPFSWEDVSLMVILMVAGFIYFWHPADSIVGGRDTGMYANHAIYIAHHGRLDVPYPWTESQDSIFADSHEQYPGIYETRSTMTIQFAHLYPVWLAQAFCTFDFDGLIRFNGFVGLLSLCILYGFCRLFLPVQFALAAVFVIGLNPGQIWVTHVTLTEIFTQLCIWGGLLLFIYSLRFKVKQLAAWSGILLGLSIWVRIDSFMIIPFVFISHFIYRIISNVSEQEDESLWLALYKTFLPIFLLGTLYHVFTTLPYLISLFPSLRPINYLMIISAILLLVKSPAINSSIKKFIEHRLIFGILSAIIVALVLYAYWIRPNFGNFAMVWDLYGYLTRDFRENSLVNLAKYLSPLVIFAAPIGWLFSFRDVIRRKKDTTIIVILMIASGFSSVFIWNPSIAPDHFWLIRRFIPVVIPGFAIFAALGLSWLIDHFLKGWMRHIPSVAAALFIVIFMIDADDFQIMVTEQMGYYKQIQSLAEHLPKDKMIFTDDAGPWATWETPLFLAFDRKVIPMNLDNDPGRTVVENYIRESASVSNPVYVVYQGNHHLNGIVEKNVDNFFLRRVFIETVTNPLPDSIIFDERNVDIYTVTGLKDDFINVKIGGRQYFGIEESGLNEPAARDAQSRWTNGNASFNIPINSNHLPRAVRIELGENSPVLSNLNIKANQVDIFNQAVAQGNWAKVLSLDGVPISKNLLIEVKSDSFVPAKTMPNSGDTRTLGVYLNGITLLDHYHPLTAAPLALPALRSSIQIDIINIGSMADTAKSLQYRARIRNNGNKVWPCLTDLPSPIGAVRLGIMWFSEKDPGKEVVEQRVDLPHAVEPGEEIEITSKLNPVGSDQKLLPLGIYMVKFSMLQEGVGWFDQKGDKSFKIKLTLQ
ncbi:MAG: hypothetical protein ACHQQQ_01660 [Bacteroidota bacterium]